MKKAWRWPVGIAVIYGSFVILLLSALVVFNMNNIELVQDDYYADQVKYQEQIDRIARAKNLQKPVKIELQHEQQAVVLQFPEFFSPDSLEGSITFYRPSSRALDYTLPLNLDQNRQQKLTVANLAKGLWKIKVAWEADGKDYYQEQTIYR